MHALRFDGQIALVTGAASGIGRATALLLAERGATVVVADRDEAGLAETVALVEGAGGTAVGRRLDVTSEADWDAAIEAVDGRWGRLDVLVNCAGIAFVRPVVDTSLDDWRRVLAVNLDGTFLGMRAALRLMRRTGEGRIVNVASASGIKAAPASSAYCASKAAAIMLTKSAALECVQDGTRIRINAVAPGGVKTPMWARTEGAAAMVGSDAWNAPTDAPPGKRFAEPGEVAHAILFLAAAESAYVTGSVLTIDAGYTA